MIKGMTGYGSGSYASDSLKVEVEVKSTNHRYRDICIHLPKTLACLEQSIRQQLQQKFLRGRFDVWVKLEEIDSNSRKLKVDIPLARQYLECLKELQQCLGIKGELDLQLVAKNTQLFWVEEEATVGDFSSPVAAAVEQAGESLANMRVQEGKALEVEIRRLLGSLRQCFSQIEERFPEFIEEYQARLARNVKNLARNIEIEPLRLAQEVALYAERSDIREELVRILCHLEQLEAFLEDRVAVGKKMDFLIQELNREVNTIGSKASDTVISYRVVAAKDLLEKIRELVQNVE